MIRPALLLLAASLVVSPAACKGRGTGEKPAAPAQVGAEAPAFQLKDLDGRIVSLSDFRGKVVLLEFWATWCAPCKATVPELIALADQYRDKGVVVLGVAMDEGAGAEKELKAFTSELKINYPVLLGSDAVAQSYVVRGIPASFLIDKGGRLVKTYMGYDESFRSAVAREIDGLL